jgi:hypothetical protein
VPLDSTPPETLIQFVDNNKKNKRREFTAGSTSLCVGYFWPETLATFFLLNFDRTHRFCCTITNRLLKLQMAKQIIWAEATSKHQIYLLRFLLPRFWQNRVSKMVSLFMSKSALPPHLSGLPVSAFNWPIPYRNLKIKTIIASN